MGVLSCPVALNSAITRCAMLNGSVSVFASVSADFWPPWTSPYSWASAGALFPKVSMRG